MRESFEFVAPTRVHFGVGKAAALPELLGDHDRWGLLSSPTVLEKSGIEEHLEACRGAGIEVELLATVSPNPRLAEVQEAVEGAGDGRAVGLLAVGGGSVIDAAKLASIAVRHGVSARRALEKGGELAAEPEACTCDLVVVPTTAGTGAEVSRGAIITDEENHVKTAARGENLVPGRAVIDPRLTLSLGPRRTAETGFDVIAHALETFLSRASTPPTDILSLAAMEEVPGALARVLEDGGDLEARTTLSLHSWLMGYNLALASTCLPHRLQYPIGSLSDTGHQVGLAALYPAWSRRVQESAPERAARAAGAIAASLGSAPGAGDGLAGAPLSEVIGALLERLGIRVSLGDLGLHAGDVRALVDGVSGRTDLDPVDPTMEEIEEIYRESLGVETD